MESKRNIAIDRKEFENQDEELKFVTEFIKRHYQKNNGVLPLWGKIQNYIYSSDSFEKQLVFDTNGNLIEEIDDFTKPQAKVTIKNKEVKV